MGTRVPEQLLDVTYRKKNIPLYDLLIKHVQNLISTVNTGSEGAWTTRYGTITPKTINTQTYLGTTLTRLFDSTVDGDINYGDAYSIKPEIFGYIFSNTNVYLLYNATGDSDHNRFRSVQIHSKHGNVVSDFTENTSYNVIMCMEDTANKVAASRITLDEYMYGSGVTSELDFYKAICAGVEKAPDPYFTVVKASTEYNCIEQSGTGGVLIPGDGTCTLSVGDGTKANAIYFNIPDDGTYLITVEGTGSYVFGSVNDDLTTFNLSEVVTGTNHRYYDINDGDGLNIIVGGNASTDDVVISRFSVVDISQIPVDNLSPDPFLETPAGIKLSVSGTVAPILTGNGIADFTGATVGAQLYTTNNIFSELGAKFIVKTVIKSMTVGNLKTFCTPNNNDGYQTDNFGTLITEAGTYYDLITTDADSTIMGIKCYSAETDAVLTEFSIYKVSDFPGIVNMGIFRGNTYYNQLLDNCEVYSSGIYFVPIRKRATTPIVHVANANGDYVKYNYNVDWPTIPLASGSNTNSEYTFINTTLSYAKLGFASEAEMKANLKVHVSYNTTSRRMVHRTTPGKIKMIYDVWYNAQKAIDNGCDIVWELTGCIPTSTGNPANMFVPVQQCIINVAQAFTKVVGWYPKHKTVKLGTTNAFSGVKVLWILYEYNDEYYIGAAYKELINDTDSDSWVDAGSLTADSTTTNYTAGTIYKITQTNCALEGMYIKCTTDQSGVQLWENLYIVDDQLISYGGTIITAFEIFKGNGWGDTEELIVVDNNVTFLDTNGNVVTGGFASYGPITLDLPV